MKVLLIEDEPKAVQTLKKGLQEQQIELEFAFDGANGKLMAQTGQYDVIISDIIMPNLNGIDLVRSLRSEGMKTPVILLTALGATDDKVQGLEAGADDYVVKPYEFRELLARIKALSRRGNDAIVTAGLLRFGDLELNLDTKECHRSGKKIDLTPKEFALMVYFIRHKGRVIPKSEIAEKVWEIDFDTHTNVIEVYISYLRNKIDKPFGQKLIHTSFGSGYILKLEEL